MSDLSVDVFKMIFLNALNSFAPVKKIYLRANHSKFVNKELSKAMMLRTKLRNKFLKQKTTETRSAYNKQRNICVSILRKAKRSYFENLDIKNLSDNRKFWGTIKPLFSNKVRSNDYIILNENDLLIRNEYKIANIFNTIFVNIVPNLGMEIDQQYPSNVSNISDPVEKAIKKYQKHPSISIINKMVSSVENEASFSFTCVTVDDISKEIKRLDIKKATQESDIPTKVIKQFPNLFIDFLHKNINSCLTEGTFPNDFKKAVVHPIHKKECKTEKSNYRPISILPNLSKIYERLLYDQMYSYFDKFFVKYQCCFRKGYNAQHCLLVMIEKMKEARDKSKVCAAVLTDLSKAFDCLKHDLLIAKLHAFGFDQKSLRFIYAYFNNRVQVTKVGSYYSEILDIIFGVPQGSILGPLLFNVNIIDLFLIEHYRSDFSNYADDTTPYNCGNTFLEVISDLETTINNLFDWFCCNNFKVNPSKCHLFLSPFNLKSINIKNFSIEGSSSKKCLGVTVDSNFTFEKHINELCKKGNQKLHALARCAKYMSTEKRRTLFNAFVVSQFNYCPLVWMFHTKELNGRINSLHEKALRLIYQNRNLSFDELLKLDKSVSIHYRNLQYLLTEIYKVKMGLSPPIMNDILTWDENASYNLRSGVTVTRRNIRTNKFGFETITTIGAVLWRNLPNDIKNSDSLNIFKHRIKQRTPDNCPCKICRNFRRIWDSYENHTCMILLHFYGGLYVPLRYLILEYLQVLNKYIYIFFQK